MDRSTYYGYIEKIILDFDTFKKFVDDCEFKEVSSFFPDDIKRKDDCQKDVIKLHHILLHKYSASELLNLYNEFIIYLSFLKGYSLSKQLRTKIQLTLSAFQDDFMKIPEKLITIEAKRFLNILVQFSDLLTTEKLKEICDSFSLSSEQYDYFIGYDLCIAEYEQLSLFNEKKENKYDNLDISIGNRRIKSKMNMNTDLSKRFSVDYEKLDELIPKIKDYLDVNSFSFFEKELQIFKTKEKSSSSSNDGYTYFYSMT